MFRVQSISRHRALAFALAALLPLGTWAAPSLAGSITELRPNGSGHVVRMGDGNRQASGHRAAYSSQGEARAGVRYHRGGHETKRGRGGPKVVITEPAPEKPLNVSSRQVGHDGRRHEGRRHDRHSASQSRSRHRGDARITRGRSGLYAGGRHGGAAIGWSNSGLIVVTVNNGAASSGMNEIAGSGSTSNSLQNCEYGAYCEIDLGGPKIITFNDIGTIRDGELVEEGADSYGK